jgi:hypothetical protein
MNREIAAARSLDDYGILRSTDKSSLGHGYLRHYERLIGHLREEPITLLEVGIFRGGSLLMWEDFLTHAIIVGMDINPQCAQYAGGRREVEIGSQADAVFLDDIGKRRNPHIIIDDGSHLADHVLLTFRTLFKHLRPGGIYVVEDIHFHAGPRASDWRGSSDFVPQDVLLRLARLVSCPGTLGDDEREWAWQVDFVEFFHGGVAIRKRAGRDPDGIETRRALVERANEPITWSRFGQYVWNHSNDLADAVQCVRRAIEMEPASSAHPDILSSILEVAGKLPDAADAANQAARLAPGDQRLQARAEALRLKV